MIIDIQATIIDYMQRSLAINLPKQLYDSWKTNILQHRTTTIIDLICNGNLKNINVLSHWYEELKWWSAPSWYVFTNYIFNILQNMKIHWNILVFHFYFPNPNIWLFYIFQNDDFENWKMFKYICIWCIHLYIFYLIALAAFFDLAPT